MRVILNKKSIFTITLSIVLIFIAHISYAKYVKTEILNAVQEIAIPIFEIEEGKSIKIDKTNNTGFYEFSIRNFNEKNKWKILTNINYSYKMEKTGIRGEWKLCLWLLNGI